MKPDTVNSNAADVHCRTSTPGTVCRGINTKCLLPLGPKTEAQKTHRYTSCFGGQLHGTYTEAECH